MPDNSTIHTATQARFLALLEPNHDRLVRFARGMTKSSEDARDLASDTIEQAYKNFHLLRSDEAFLSWIFTIARRLQSRRRLRSKIFEPFEMLRHDRTSQTHAAPDVHTDAELLYDALEQLPQKYREAFVLFEISGLSLKELQELQGGSLSAVKMRLARAREQLRALLGERPPNERATIHDLSDTSRPTMLSTTNSTTLNSNTLPNTVPNAPFTTPQPNNVPRTSRPKTP